MEKELYENSYKNSRHFSFGKNWENFLDNLSENRISSAKESLVDFLGGEEKIRGKTFIDIGCGSGLFSLVAFRLGASKVVSVDVDEFSISCTKRLKEREKDASNWDVIKGSALDEGFIKSLGKFDVVYSWGVLHHSGNMYKALRNVAGLMNSSSLFYLAIYNNNKNKWKEGTSRLWLKIKKIYNNSGQVTKKVIYYLYSSYFLIGLLIMGINPIKYINSYKSNRGMNWRNDIIDWLGGYPYEFATPDEIVNFFGKKDINCKKIILRDGIGCSEYLLVNAHE